MSMRENGRVSEMCKKKNKKKTSLAMNLTLTILHKTKKRNKLYYTGDDP